MDGQDPSQVTMEREDILDQDKISEAHELINTHRNSFNNLIYKENTALLNCKLEKMEINYTF